MQSLKSTNQVPGLRGNCVLGADPIEKSPTFRRFFPLFLSVAFFDLSVNEKKTVCFTFFAIHKVSIAQFTYDSFVESFFQSFSGFDPLRVVTQLTPSVL